MADKKITVGIFWVCDDGGEFEFIWDKEVYDADWRSDFGDEFIVYEKSHIDVWKPLAAKFFDGKYKKYKFNDFPRGRVTFDSDEGVYMVDCDVKLKKILPLVKEKMLEFFGVEKAVYQKDVRYKSRIGKLHS